MVCDSPIWRDGWEKLIAQERFTHTEVNLRIHGPVLHTEDVWHAFEVKHGNEDTFKVCSFFKWSSNGQEMLRIKRSVQAQYNTDVGYVAASAQAGQAQIDTNSAIDEGDPMAVLERNATLSGFVKSSTGPVGGGVPPVREAEEPKEGDDAPMDNPDAIELGSDDEDDTMKEG